MDENILENTIQEMLRTGILAADESRGTIEKPKTIDKRLMAVGLRPTDEVVNAWRELVRDTPGLGKYISAVILEMSRVPIDAAIYAANGTVPGVKVDGGTEGKVGNNEKLTIGLEGLDNKLGNYRGEGARFAKWRTVYKIGDGLPTEKAVIENNKTQVKYALACQKASIVPVCEPEVLIDGNHSISDSSRVTREVLLDLFAQANKEGVYLPGMILKTSMVIYGKELQRKRDATEIEEVARQTIQCLRETVPTNVGGVVFLSGGQEDYEAVHHLNRIHRMVLSGDIQLRLPWRISFSYSRAIQNVPMELWSGNPATVGLAQEALLERARACALASYGALNPSFQYQILAPPKPK